MFDVFSSYWFKGITVLLAASVLACSVNRAPKLWRVATHPRPSMGETFFVHAPLQDRAIVAEEPGAALERVREVLHRHHFRVISHAEDEGLGLYADRFRWGPFGTVIAHVSFVIILLGFLLSATTGFKDQGFVAPVGETVAVGHSTGLAIHANSFTETDYASGEPKDYSADVVLTDHGRQVRHEVIRVNHPMKYNGIWIYQSSFGVAALHAGEGRDGRGPRLHLPGALRVHRRPAQLRVRSPSPGKDLTVFVVEAASGQVDPAIKAGQVQLEIHQGNNPTPAAVQVIDQGKATAIGGLTYTFERNRQYTGLIVAHDPGQGFVWVGSALFVIGLVLVFFFPHRRIWVRVRTVEEGTEVQLASTIKRDPAFEPQFHELITDIQLGGAPSSTTSEGA